LSTEVSTEVSTQVCTGQRQPVSRRQASSGIPRGAVEPGGKTTRVLAHTQSSFSAKTRLPLTQAEIWSVPGDGRRSLESLIFQMLSQQIEFRLYRQNQGFSAAAARRFILGFFENRGAVF
jgi:hypothetical protein